MNKICRITKQQSPLCGDWEQLKFIDRIAIQHGLDIEILIGITYAESKIGIHFAPSQECGKMNNR